MRNKTTSPNLIQSFFYRVFINEKLNNWTGFFLAIIIAAVLGFIGAGNLATGLAIFAAIAGLSVLIFCVLSPEAGLYVITLYGFLASALSRFVFNDQMPVGTVTDILVFASFMGLFFSNTALKANTTAFFKNRPVIYYTIILIYLTLELFNPIGHSFAGWLQVMRKVFESFLIVFLAYNVFDTFSKIRRYLNFLFTLCVLIALYGCFQEWHGLLSAEISWVNEDPVRFGLISIWGEYRKFSLLGGPTEFGIVMAATALFFLVTGFNEKSWFRKIVYISGSVFMVLAMSYSGTRTANAMLVGGIAILLLLNLDKKPTWLISLLAVLAFLFVLYAPIYSSSTLLRFRSTFSATKDASYNVREINRKRVQPFIWSHPFGSGLSTTGGMGQKYNPGNPNAGFPTDSSYLNKALESGSIGMALTCLLYFFMLQYTIRGFFVSSNKQVKALFAASVAFFFAFFLGEITQEAVGVFSNMVIYFPIFAIVLKLRQFSGKESPAFFE